METRYFRDDSGWNAETHLEIAHTPRLLSIRSCKRGGAGTLTTTASVATRGENGLLTHVLTYGAAGGDFNKIVAHSQPGRVTESAVRQQHQLVLGRINEILADVASFYDAQKRLGTAAKQDADRAHCS